jgi:hypothetical protein
MRGASKPWRGLNFPRRQIASTGAERVLAGTSCSCDTTAATATAARRSAPPAYPLRFQRRGRGRNRRRRRHGATSARPRLDDWPVMEADKKSVSDVTSMSQRARISADVLRAR